MAEEFNNIELIMVLKADKTKAILTTFNYGLRQKTTGIPELANIPIYDIDIYLLANSR